MVASKGMGWLRGALQLGKVKQGSGCGSLALQVSLCLPWTPQFPPPCCLWGKAMPAAPSLGRRWVPTSPPGPVATLSPS